MSIFYSLSRGVYYALPIILVVLLIVYKCTSSEKKKRGLKIALIVVCALQVCAFIYTAYFFINFMNYFKWQTQDDLSDVEIVNIAEDYYLIPELAPHIESVSERGFQDHEYIYETTWFESVDALFDILPYGTEEERQAALDLLDSSDNSTDEFPDNYFGDKVELYRIDEIELSIEMPEQGRTVDKYDYYNYFVAIRSDNGQASLILYSWET